MADRHARDTGRRLKMSPRAEPPPPGWRCPDCGRAFTRRTREHSCDVSSLESHLAGKSPEVRETWAALAQALTRIGPHRVTPLKTMVTLSVGSNFGGLRFTRTNVALELLLGRAVASPRIHKVQVISPRSIAHHLRLGSPADVDEELVRWLAESYQIGASGGRRG
jgi:hypothetical protein